MIASNWDSVAAVLFTVLLIGIIYAAVLSPPVQRRRQLRKLANQDYRHARGTVHLSILRKALDRTTKKHKACQRALNTARNKKARLEAHMMDNWRHLLVNYLLLHRLREIRGIGEALSRALYDHAQGQGDLRRLYSASRYVKGIGPARQGDINAWVARYEKAMPELIAGDFPGKETIWSIYAPEIEALEAESTRLSAEEAMIAARLDRLQAAIAPLQKVKRRTLLKALKNTQSTPDEVESYLRGAFPEWEPVPDWFQDLVEEAAA